MRKGELVELCDSVGYKEYETPVHLAFLSTDRLTSRSYEGLKKTDIEVGLDEYLTTNAPKYSSDTRLAPFYKTRRGLESPVKKETASALSDTETKVKQVKRRVTKAAEEFLPTLVARRGCASATS
jgi:hypothetical protein